MLSTQRLECDCLYFLKVANCLFELGFGHLSLARLRSKGQGGWGRTTATRNEMNFEANLETACAAFVCAYKSLI